MNMTDTSSMLWALLFSSIGMGYFVYGKKQANKVALLCGIGLMVFPYFTSNDYVIVLTGIGLMAVPKYVSL